MKRVNFSLNSNPLVTTLGGISWLKELRAADSDDFATVVDGKRPGQLETRAVVIGELADYRLYFLTSRARVRLACMSDAKDAYIVLERDEAGTLSRCRFLLESDMPQDTARPQARATLTITEELRKSIQKAGSTSYEIEGVSLPSSGYFSNAIAFHFKQGEHPVGPVAMNLVPALSRFIKFDNSDEAAAFRCNMNYEVHYIGQATTIESRLHAHEKIRAMADILLTKRLDHEPVVFGYTFNCDQAMEPSLSLDLIEATLIQHFKPALNVDKRNFPKAVSPTERGLEKKLAALPIAQVTVSPVGDLHAISSDHARQSLLSDGCGITFNDAGALYASSLTDITVQIK